MLDDFLGELFGEVVFGRLSRSRRAQLLFRIFFGLIGGFLGGYGAWHFAGRTDFTANTPLRWSMVALFAAMACFFLFNVGLGRRWRWPGRLFVVAFVMLFITRFAFGP